MPSGTGSKRYPCISGFSGTLATVLVDPITDRVWNGSTWELFNPAHVATYGLATPQLFGGVYYWNVPGIAAQTYIAFTYAIAGASLALGDLNVPRWADTFNFDGTSAYDSLTTAQISGVVGSLFTGPCVVSIVFVDAAGHQVADVPFTILATPPVPGIPQPIGATVSDGNGSIVLGLQTGNYAIVAAVTNGVFFPQTSFSVTGLYGNAVQVVGMTGAGTANAPPGMVMAEGYTYGAGSGVLAGQPVYYRMVSAPAAGIFPGGTQTAISDSNGLVQVELWQNAEYEFWYGRGERESLVTTTVSPVQIPGLLSDQNAPP